MPNAEAGSIHIPMDSINSPIPSYIHKIAITTLTLTTLA